MAKAQANIGRYTSAVGDKHKLSGISLEEALNEINQSQCLYIRNIKDNKILFMSPRLCRLLGKKTFDAIVKDNNIANINYTNLYRKYEMVGKDIVIKL